jgi:ankyrin repeat protein
MGHCRLLVEGGASIAGMTRSVYSSALHLAAANGEKLIVEWLLAEGGVHLSDVDEQEYTALLSTTDHLANDNAKMIG